MPAALASMPRGRVRRGPDQPDGGEGQVDVQRPAPVQVLGQQAAEQEADRAGDPGDGAEDRERAAAGSADAAANPARPAMKVRLRPSRSDSLPPSSSRLPNASA